MFKLDLGCSVTHIIPSFSSDGKEINPLHALSIYPNSCADATPIRAPSSLYVQPW